MKNQYKYTVCIHCMTYNHEKYLTDALEGFVMQKTNFPFVAVVIDDFSTDGTADVLRKYEAQYPDIIKAIYLTENYHSQRKPKKPLLEPYDSQAKYIAICEGDDYWIDPYKLQKQVDILEANESLMLTCSNRRLVDMNGNTLEDCKAPLIPDKQSCRITMRDYFKYNTIYPTASVVYRNTHREEVSLKIKHMDNPFLGDWTMWIALHCFGDCYYIDEPLSAYRVNPTSVTHTQWVKDRVGRIKMEFDLQPRVADVLPEEYADIATDLRNTKWAYLPLAKAYYKNKQYVRMMGALIVYFVKNPRNIGHLFKKVCTKVLKKIKK
ncbi:MAG: glycosyltransferase [Paludibacteraceae bacterium]|nr:glycosyltransferase [Paludibacteraceae bacterium]